MKIQREQAIEAALGLLASEGIEGLTMRKLALVLKIQAPSLYWHFTNKQALLDGIAEEMVKNVARKISARQSWRTTVRQVADELRQALLAHRDGARVFAGTYVVADNVLRTGEALIGAFVKAGADSRLAANTAYSLVYYVLGSVMEEQALGPDGDIDLPERKKAFARLTENRYPNNWAARDVMFDGDFDQRFSTGVELMLAGFEVLLARR